VIDFDHDTLTRMAYKVFTPQDDDEDNPEDSRETVKQGPGSSEDGNNSGWSSTSLLALADKQDEIRSDKLGRFRMNMDILFAATRLDQKQVLPLLKVWNPKLWHRLQRERLWLKIRARKMAELAAQAETPSGRGDDSEHNKYLACFILIVD